jgi:hypothetical protein
MAAGHAASAVSPALAWLTNKTGMRMMSGTLKDRGRSAIGAIDVISHGCLACYE